MGSRRQNYGTLPNSNVNMICAMRVAHYFVIAMP
jgi:hypothetical protein